MARKTSFQTSAGRAAIVAALYLGGSTMLPAEAAPAGQVASFSGLAAVDDNTLGTLHGRGGIITYNITGQNNMSGSITGSNVTAGGNITSGNVDMSGNAMQNFNGVSNFIANSGNNNNLQAGVVLNITMQ
jgi:hypothetical protein